MLFTNVHNSFDLGWRLLTADGEKLQNTGIDATKVPKVPEH